uniref:CCHC-type domain-containing protein n=1 Tax=Strongyloides stercoralis TaxID=6248 RepID=A0A0K0EC37_STRER
MIKLFRGLGHLKGLSEYGINYGIPMLETEELRINEDFQRSRLRRKAATTTSFQGNCYTCGKAGHHSYQCKKSITTNEGRGKNNVKTMLIKESEAKEIQQLLDLIRMDNEILDSTDDYNRMLTIFEVTNMVNHEKT